jgi:hypothetical protein
MSEVLECAERVKVGASAGEAELVRRDRGCSKKPAVFLAEARIQRKARAARGIPVDALDDDTDRGVDGISSVSP